MIYAIGIDLGGTKIEGVLLQDGKVVRGLKFPTEARLGKKKVLDNILQVISFLDDGKVKIIGIGTPGFVDKKDKIFSIRNIPGLIGFDIVRFLKNKTKKEVSIHNDAKCFAYAEHKLGSGKGHKNMVGVVIGTGIGYGLIIDAKLYEGNDHGASELGHTVISDKKDRCSCGNQGDFESLCSGPNLLKRHNAIKGIKKLSSVEDIFRSKNKRSKAFVDESLEYMAKGIANVVNLLDPGIIVLGGGISKLNIHKDLNKRFRKYTNKISAGNKIVKASLGHSGAIGAALLSVQK